MAPKTTACHLCGRQLLENSRSFHLFKCSHASFPCSFCGLAVLLAEIEVNLVMYTIMRASATAQREMAREAAQVVRCYVLWCTRYTAKHARARWSCSAPRQDKGQMARTITDWTAL